MTTATMTGKVCLITGGTNGIGKSAALTLAQRGAVVVLVGRDAARAAQAVQEIRAASDNAQVDMLLADLSSQAEVRRLAAEFKQKYQRLHVLLNNAGALYFKRQLTVDRLDLTFALNHLAPFLLTDLLLDLLYASAPARIINVSSSGHSSGKIDFDNLQGEHVFGPFAYANAKLANILFTLELARRLAGTGVTVNAVHPGFVATGFAKNNGKLIATLWGLSAPWARTPARGAETLVYLAASPEVEGVTGQYFYDRRAIPPAPRATDLAVARQLWDVSAALVHPPAGAPD